MNFIIEKVIFALNKFKLYLSIIYFFILNTLITIVKIIFKIYSKLIRKIRENLFKLISLVCLIFLIYNAIDMTIDFLQFDYEYSLIMNYNKDGIDLMPISVCTESNTLLNRRKVINSFDIDLIQTKYENDAFNYLYPVTYEVKKFPDIHHDCNLKSNHLHIASEFYYMEMKGILKWYLNLCNNRFYQYYERLIFAEMSFDELEALTFESNELFGCSAKVHFKNITNIESNRSLDNCFGKYSVKKTIKANKEFGVCYTFFDKNYGILLETEDFINISIKFLKQQDFIKDNNKRINIDISGRYKQNYLELYSKNYFRLFIFLEKENKVKGNIIELNRSPSDITMNIITETNELLSTPYMDICQQSGNNCVYNNEYSHICLTVSCITAKFAKSKQVHWSRIGSNVNLRGSSEKFITTSVNEFSDLIL